VKKEKERKNKEKRPLSELGEGRKVAERWRSND